MNFMVFLLVCLGGALGSGARYIVGSLSVALFGTAFPYGTILINILGSFAIGWYAAHGHPHAPHPPSEEMRAFVMAGLCGGFTTFSAFSLQTFDLLRTGYWHLAWANVLLSVALCLGATMFGYVVGFHETLA
jgi:CrcB protein